MSEEACALVALLSLLLAAVAVVYAFRVTGKNDAARERAKELEATIACLQKELKESKFREQSLERRINSIDKSMITLGYHELRTRIKQFFLTA